MLGDREPLVSEDPASTSSGIIHMGSTGQIRPLLPQQLAQAEHRKGSLAFWTRSVVGRQRWANSRKVMGCLECWTEQQDHILVSSLLYGVETGFVPQLPHLEREGLG